MALELKKTLEEKYGIKLTKESGSVSLSDLKAEKLQLIVNFLKKHKDNEKLKLLFKNNQLNLEDQDTYIKIFKLAAVHGNDIITDVEDMYTNMEMDLDEIYGQVAGEYDGYETADDDILSEPEPEPEPEPETEPEPSIASSSTENTETKLKLVKKGLKYQIEPSQEIIVKDSCFLVFEFLEEYFPVSIRLNSLTGDKLNNYINKVMLTLKKPPHRIHLENKYDLLLKTTNGKTVLATLQK